MPFLPKMPCRGNCRLRHGRPVPCLLVSVLHRVYVFRPKGGGPSARGGATHKPLDKKSALGLARPGRVSVPVVAKPSARRTGRVPRDRRGRKPAFVFLLSPLAECDLVVVAASGRLLGVVSRIAPARPRRSVSTAHQNVNMMKSCAFLFSLLRRRRSVFFFVFWCFLCVCPCVSPLLSATL